MLIIKDSHRWPAFSAIDPNQLRTRGAISVINCDWAQAGTLPSMMSAAPMLRVRGYR